VLLSTAEAAGQLPRQAKQYQRELTRIAQQHWGLGAPVARFGAQVHMESTWRTKARSHVAYGLAQFTAGTARWISRAYHELGPPAPYSPRWALRALVLYDRHIYERVEPMRSEMVPECDRWAMVLAAYNGGPGWLRRDRRLAARRGSDPDRWWGEVSEHSARAERHRKGNRWYVRRILFRLEPRYSQAGWGGESVCRG